MIDPYRLARQQLPLVYCPRFPFTQVTKGPHCRSNNGERHPEPISLASSLPRSLHKAAQPDPANLILYLH